MRLNATSLPTPLFARGRRGGDAVQYIGKRFLAGGMDRHDRNWSISSAQIGNSTFSKRWIGLNDFGLGQVFDRSIVR